MTKRDANKQKEAGQKERAWFRHLQSGQVFEAEGAQLHTARKSRDLEEVPSPDAAVRMELDKRGIKYSDNSKLETLQKKLAEAIEAEEEAEQEAGGAAK